MKNIKKHEIYNLYKNYIAKYKLISFLFIFFSIIATIISLIKPIITGNMIDLLINNSIENRMNIIYVCITILVITYILEMIISFFLNVLCECIRQKISFRLINKLINHLQNSSILNLLNKDIAYLIDLINTDCYVLINFLLEHIVNLCVNILCFIISISFLVYVNIKMAMIVGASIPIYIIMYLFFKNKLFNASLKLKDSQSNFISILYGQLDNIKFLRVNRLFDYLGNILNKSFKDFFNNCISYTKKSYIFSGSGQILSNILFIVLIIIGAKQILIGQLTVGTFTIINSYIGKIIENISYFLSFSSDYQNMLVSFHRIKKIQSFRIDNVGSIKLKNIESINIKNITFSIENNKNLLNNLSFKFEKKKLYIIKGPNGSGKSTLINLILGLFYDYNGIIEYNGIDLKKININYLLENLISIVDQEPIILKDTLINNITLGKNIYDYNQIIKYLENFNMNDFIRDINVRIIESSTISGGQKQKISIIRALIKNPQVLILDEPTSALDKISIDYLQKLILNQKKDKIIIIITHDTIFDSISDRIITIEK